MTTPTPPDPSAPNPDKLALVKAGKQVRARLAADPGAYRFPVDKAEIYAVGDFLSPDECAGMMALIDKVAKPSSAFDVDYGARHRTSYSGDVDRGELLVRMVERRIDDLLGIDPDFGEAVQGQRYLKGQEFKPHCDWFWTKADYWKKVAKQGGQRSWTAMAYLSAVEEGGETMFTRLGISVPPQPGALLVWNNSNADGSPNWDTMHAGMPVLRGVKYVITKWYRTRAWS
ncbi:MAG: 2OG-Fe(II) oxygenase [Novosphingobium sp.]